MSGREVKGRLENRKKAKDVREIKNNGMRKGRERTETEKRTKQERIQDLIKKV